MLSFATTAVMAMAMIAPSSDPTRPEVQHGSIDWLASYPKSGNTWMRLLLSNYYSDKEEPHDINKPGVSDGIASSRWLFDSHMGLSSADLTDDEAMAMMPGLFRELTRASTRKHWIKVHDAQARLADGEWMFPPDATGGIIYIIRNPLDVAVSRAFHDGHGDMDKAVAMLCNVEASISGGPKSQLRQVMGDWSHHVRSWVDQDDIPVIVVRYEDMLADTAGELRRVLAFARADEPIDETRIARAVTHTAFETLQAAEARDGFREVTQKQERFFRSGKSGDWKSHLTADHVATLCACHAEVMARFGFDAS
jgi:aryl sulfotransferase